MDELAGELKDAILVEPPWSLTQEEADDLDEAERIAGLVNYSGQEFDVEGQVRRLNNGDITVPSRLMQNWFLAK